MKIYLIFYSKATQYVYRKLHDTYLGKEIIEKKAGNRFNRNYIYYTSNWAYFKI